MRGLQPARFTESSPFCGDASGPEDLTHLLVACPRWDAARTRFLVPVWREAGVLSWRKRASRARDLAYLLLGGRVGSRCGPSAARGVQSPLGASCSNWLVSVSRFLREVGPPRLRELRRTAEKSQCRQPGGRTGPGGPDGSDSGDA